MFLEFMHPVVVMTHVKLCLCQHGRYQLCIWIM